MSSTSHQETEAKFVVHSPALGSKLRTAPNLSKQYTLSPATTVAHLDCYLDTPDYSLLRGGYALRMRQASDGYRVTIKSLNFGQKSTLHKRLEIEEPLGAATDPADWESWPQAVRAVLSNKLLAAQKVQPICVIHQTRHKRMVTFTTTDVQAGEPFAELSVDEIQILRTERMPQNAIWAMAWQELPSLSAWCELEVELLPGQDESALEALSVNLSKRRGLRPVQASKFERALILTHASLRVAGQEIDQLVPELTMGDACRLIWRKQLAQLLLNEAGVRYSEDIEYVHAMRVAVRRMRTALRFFGRFFRPKAIRPFGRALRTTGRLLGAVRDRDVALARLAKHVRKVEKRRLDDFESFAQTWRAEREQIFGELLAWLDSDDYHRFVTQFARFCARAGKGLRRTDRKGEGGQLPHQVRHVLPAVIVKRYSRVRAFEALFESGKSPPLQTLHQLRIQCKFLRYTLEFVQPLLGTSGDRLITALKQLQDQLGTLHDAAVSQSLLEEGTSAEGEAGAASYYASQQEIIDRLQREVATALGNFVSPATRRLLAQAVMRI